MRPWNVLLLAAGLSVVVAGLSLLLPASAQDDEALSAGNNKDGDLTLVDVPMVVCPTSLLGEFGEPSATESNYSVQLRLPSTANSDRKKLPDYALAFQRSFLSEMTVTFQLMDANGKEMTPRLTEVLPGPASVPTDGSGLETTTTAAPEPAPAPEAMAQRLLREAPADWFPEAAAEGDFDMCEEFFLLDGRSPVEYPYTWGEAKDAFHDICAQESAQDANCTDVQEQLFGAGSQGDDLGFNASDELCQRIFTHPAFQLQDAGLLAPRRLKGGWSPHFRMTPARTAASYPRGVSEASYGSRGWSSVRRGSVFTMALSTGTGVGLLAGSYPLYSRMNVHCPGGTCCGASQGGCSMPQVSTADMLRDDLTTTSFFPGDFAEPYILRVFGVSSPNFARADLCPPEGDTVPDAWISSVQWDLFAQLSAVEFESDSTPWYEKVLAIFFFGFVVVAFYGCPFLCFYGVYRVWWSLLVRVRIEAEEKQMLESESSSSE